MKLFLEASILCIEDTPISKKKPEKVESSEEESDEEVLPKGKTRVVFVLNDERDPDITTVKELPKRTVSEVAELREEIRKKVNKPDGYPAITSMLVAKLITYYDAYFLNNLLAKGLRTHKLGMIAVVNTLATKTAGTAGRVKDNMEISISSTLLTNVTAENCERLFANKTTCVIDRLDALMEIVEHEIVHILAFLDEDANEVNAKGKIDAADSHGEWFMKTVAKLFRHTSFRHNLIDTPGMENRTKLTTKEDLRIGQKVHFIAKGDEKMSGKVIKINPKNARVSIGPGLEYNVPYSLVLIE